MVFLQQPSGMTTNKPLDETVLRIRGDPDRRFARALLDFRRRTYWEGKCPEELFSANWPGLKGERRSRSDI
jgi:hypothetical protein